MGFTYQKVKDNKFIFKFAAVWMHQQTFAHLPLDEVAVFWTIDFFVFQEDTVTMTSTHEVVVTGA